MFAPIPPWEGAHPILVHVPIGVLVIVPLFIVLSLVWRSHTKAFSISALLLLLVGTFGALLAASSGEAAYEYAEEVLGVTGEAEMQMERHEEAGELSRNIFIGLTILYAAVVFLPFVWEKARATKVSVPIVVTYLIIYGLGLGQLANTGHLGGVLVHKYGVHAPLDGTVQTLSVERGDHDDE